MRTFLCNVPEYWQYANKPQNYEDFCARFHAEDHGPLGLWRTVSRDRYTGEVLMEQWNKNIITDVGTTAMLKNTWNTSGSAVSIYNLIAISATSGCTTLTSAISGTTTSLPVAALPAAIASGTSLQVGFGTGSPQTVTTSATASIGATSISVTSFSASSWGVGTNVAPLASTSDNPTAITGAQYSGTPSFTYSGTGVGARQVVISYTFNGGGGYTVGNYTDVWTVNTNPVGAAGETASHLIQMPAPLNGSANLTITDTLKV